MIKDLISRQAAIDAIAEIVTSMSVCVSVDECHGMKKMQDMAIRTLNDLPLVQLGKVCIANITLSEEQLHEVTEKAVEQVKNENIQVFPSAQPERKKGIWLPRNSAFQKWFRCSECAYRLYELKGTKFCPNCGADMREEKKQ